MAQLVTITCKDDFDLCLYQLRSIYKFVEPCIVNVIVNETNITEYKSAIEKIQCSTHKVVVWSQWDILQQEAPHPQGWCSQQLLKLLIPIDDDYICLDCKDIFIKNTKLHELDKLQRGKMPSVRRTHPWNRFFNKLHNVLFHHYGTLVKDTKLHPIATPRSIKQSVLKEIPKIWKTNKKFIRWFGQFGMPSEFILYDCLEQYLTEVPHRSNRFKKNEILEFWYTEDVDFNSISKSTRIVKIHRRIYNDNNINKKVQEWLKKLLTTS